MLQLSVWLKKNIGEILTTKIVAVDQGITQVCASGSSPRVGRPRFLTARCQVDAVPAKFHNTLSLYLGGDPFCAL